jgi:hypothetical protein
MTGKLVSQPNVEPDPKYNPKEHLVMWKNEDEVRGPTAVQILRDFFHPQWNKTDGTLDVKAD